MPFASGTPGRRRGFDARLVGIGRHTSFSRRRVCRTGHRAGEWPGPGGVVTTKVHPLVAGHHGACSRLVAPSESAALDAFVAFTEPWGNRYTPRPKPTGLAFLVGWLVGLAALTAIFVEVSGLVGGLNKRRRGLPGCAS